MFEDMPHNISIFIISFSIYSLYTLELYYHIVFILVVFLEQCCNLREISGTRISFGITNTMVSYLIYVIVQGE